MITTPSLHPLAAAYLKRLDRAARRLPRSERRDLTEEISAHLAEAITPEMSDAEALTVLDRLGDPEDIVEAQRPEEPQRWRSLGAREWTAILLLLLGGFIFYVGWIAGAVLLWTSTAWNLRDKLIGTLLVPGGLATALVAAVLLGTKQTCRGFAGGVQRCTPGPSTLHTIVSIAILGCCVVGPIFTAVYLARRAR